MPFLSINLKAACGLEKHADFCLTSALGTATILQDLERVITSITKNDYGNVILDNRFLSNRSP